ncbi:TRAP transporter large permease subunit [Arthrobacter sp. NPDC089319]|uniref:TRAP transporter large permease n=1 Tax=Arthrobacter sp. NPDC089319 TaxID=3155915 RepID=UPI003443ECD5
MSTKAITQPSESPKTIRKTQPSSPPRSAFAFWLCTALSLVIALAILYGGLDRTIVGLLVIALTITAMLAGVNIAVSMLGASILGLIELGGWRTVESTFSTSLFSAAASWQLSVIPLFVLMGIAMWRSGMTAHVYTAAHQWFGGLPGGLAIGTNFAGAGLAAASGSSVGISYALGRIAIPEMFRAGYSPALATGVVQMAGTLGQLIPPSVFLVIYAGVAQVPVGPQLLAAVVPGVAVAIGFALTVLVWVWIRPDAAPRGDRTGITWVTRMRSLSGVVPLAVVMIAVIGSLFAGLATPTEAGAVGAIAALVIGWLMLGRGRRGPRATWTFVRASLSDAAVSTASIFLLLIATVLLSRVVTLSQIGSAMSELVVNLNLDTTTFLLLLIVLYLILGLVLEPLALLLITMPVMAAPLAAMDVNLLWFGIFLVLLAEIAIVTPPVGMLSFIVHRLAQKREVNLGVRVKLTDVFRGAVPFIAMALLLVVILVFFPDIALWLPNISSAK